jgi:hypothetical protein
MLCSLKRFQKSLVFRKLSLATRENNDEFITTIGCTYLVLFSLSLERFHQTFSMTVGSHKIGSAAPVRIYSSSNAIRLQPKTSLHAHDISGLDTVLKAPDLKFSSQRCRMHRRVGAETPIKGWCARNPGWEPCYDGRQSDAADHAV